LAQEASIKARVTVYPRPEVLDPQGQAIAAALGRLGFDQVREVRAGKSFDVDLATGDQAAARTLVEQMCERLLVNPIVEDFRIECPAGDGRP